MPDRIPRRLDKVETQLSAKQRVVAWLQAHKRGEEPDRKLTEWMPPDQKREYDRLSGLVDGVNNRLLGHVAFWQRSIVEMEVELGWLESLSAWQARAELLAAYLRNHHKIQVRERKPGARGGKRTLLVEPLPRTWRGLQTELKYLYGGQSDEEGYRSHPPQGEQLASVLAAMIGTGVQMRWQDLEAVEAVLQEVAAELDGESPALPETREALDGCRKVVREIAGELQRWSGPVALPSPADENLEWAREVVGLPV